MGYALAARLRTLREPLTQKELSLIFRVSAGLISTWESGIAVPPTQRLVQYASYFRPNATDVLLEELMSLRDQDTHLVRTERPVDEIKDLLKEIWHVLKDIRDRLPPPT